MSANLLSAARAAWDSGLSFLFPDLCQMCRAHRATPAEGYVCADCWKDLRFITPPMCERCGVPFKGEITTAFECANCREMELHFSRARSVIAARGIALDVIHRYKYDGDIWFEPFLAKLFVNGVAPQLCEAAPQSKTWDLLVPVPLHPLKLREREFNQAERLAQHLSRSTGIPVANDLLHRREITRTQARLTRPERAANVRRAFARAPGARCDGRRIVLIDDVLTTGATTSACARVLLDAGAAEVCVWTLARGLLR